MEEYEQSQEETNRKEELARTKECRRVAEIVGRYHLTPGMTSITLCCNTAYCHGKKTIQGVNYDALYQYYTKIPAVRLCELLPNLSSRDRDTLRTSRCDKCQSGSLYNHFSFRSK